jgi:hypothetical protein
MSYLGNGKIFWQNTWINPEALRGGFFAMKF